VRFGKVHQNEETVAGAKSIVRRKRLTLCTMTSSAWLDKTAEALALIRDLKPIHEKLQAEQDAAAAARVAARTGRTQGTHQRGEEGP